MTREEVLENLSVQAWNREGDECRALLSAIELLSPVAPERRDIPKELHAVSDWHWVCGNCRNPVYMGATVYCDRCGKKVKWDDCLW